MQKVIWTWFSVLVLYMGYVAWQVGTLQTWLLVSLALVGVFALMSLLEEVSK